MTGAIFTQIFFKRRSVLIVLEALPEVRFASPFASIAGKWLLSGRLLCQSHVEKILKKIWKKIGHKTVIQGISLLFNMALEGFEKRPPKAANQTSGKASLKEPTPNS